MSRTRISYSARKRFIDNRKIYRKPASLRSHCLALQSQDLLDEAVAESLRLPELPWEHEQCYGQQDLWWESDCWDLRQVDVLSDYKWQLGETCRVLPVQLSKRWGISYVPTAWDDLQPQVSVRDAAFDAKAKLCCTGSARQRYVYEWVPTECYSYDWLAVPRKRVYTGKRLLKQRTSFDILLPASISIEVPDKSPLAGKVQLVACALPSSQPGYNVWRVQCSSASAWGWRHSANLPRGWLLINAGTFTLSELASLPEL